MALKQDRRSRWGTAALVVVSSFCGSWLLQAQTSCKSCHQGVWETYAKTGMGRSFYRLTAENLVEDFSENNTYYHKASDSYFTMFQREGKYFQVRYQKDEDGRRINVLEKQIDYVMGSGNHVRAYLNRTNHDKLVELPLAWYTEKGGYWGMNPGYDRPNHDGFRREITYDCMFCHNAYPEIPAGNAKPFAEAVYTGALPEGIDCQRCHGPGDRHVAAATRTGAAAAEIRLAIVNPARLNAERQMEVCMQCHLETTSFPLPNGIQRYERGTFSYRPGEALADFILAFDHAPGKGREEKFEIVNAAYRLRRSACFLKSEGKLSCTTCHNPHDVPRGAEATRHYAAVCRKCHASAFEHLVSAGKHSGAAGCTDCHMPKRRTEDVVHVVMTDHYIQRRLPMGDLLAEREERHETEATAYRGQVVPYYPNRLPANDLYLALAQVIQKSNLSAGIPLLTAAIEKARPARPEYYFELAEALRETGQTAKALSYYREAVKRDPKFVNGLRKLGTALRRSGAFAESSEVLKKAVAEDPSSAATWRELGLTYQAQGTTREAVAALEKAIAMDPDMSEAHNNLGVIRFASGDPAQAEQAFREAIRIQPDYADAHSNLGNLLSGTGDLKQALGEFEVALRLRPEDAPTRYNYAMVLGRGRRFDEAQRELESAVRTDPGFVDAHLLLGDLLMAKGQSQAALPHYREAMRRQPESGRALLSLGAALAAVGDVAGAVPYLRKAVADSNPAVRDEAERILRQLPR